MGVAVVAAVTLGLRALAGHSTAADSSAASFSGTRFVGDGSWLVGTEVAPPVSIAAEAEGEPVAEPALSPTPPAEAALPIVPAIDEPLKARLRDVYLEGQAMGRDAGAFAKVGDSITASPHFLTEIGCGTADTGDDRSLDETIAFFGKDMAGTVGGGLTCDDLNAFTRVSQAAGVGWVAAQVLTPMADPPPGCRPPDDTPLRCELAQTDAAVALVMLGTNDLHQGVGLNSFRASLTMVVDEIVDAGAIPVVSTIPPRLDSASANAKVGDYNAVVRTVASERAVPLWNFWRAVAAPDMVDGGMAPDGVHPNVLGGGAILAGNGLRYGYNQRNLTALQVLDAIRRVVIEDGPAD